MSSKEERVLSLAREAWKHAEPTDAESEFAAHRIARRMRRSARPRRSRRPTLILVFAVVALGGLAFAASGGGWFGQSRPSSEGSRVQKAVRSGFGAAPASLARVRVASKALAPKADSPEPTSPEQEGEARAGEPKAAVPAGGSGSAVGAASGAAGSTSSSQAPPAASWRAVDEALDAKDDARAKKALAGLAGSKDATTRAKARLGLAQLAKSKGDCAEARRLAFEVTAMPDLDPVLFKRARAIVLECE